MHMTDFVGRWENVEICSPTGLSEDEQNEVDAFHFEYGLTSWLELRVDGSALLHVAGEDYEGDYRVDGDAIHFDGDSRFALAKVDGVIEVGGVAWAGLSLRLRFEKANSGGFSAKMQVRIREIWREVCDCDAVDPEEVARLLDEGGTEAAAYLHGPESDIWMLSAIINLDEFALAKRMIEMGAKPLEENLRAARYRAENCRFIREGADFLSFIEARFEDVSSAE